MAYGTVNVPHGSSELAAAIAELRDEMVQGVVTSPLLTGGGEAIMIGTGEEALASRSIGA